MMLLVINVENNFVFNFKDSWTPKTGSRTVNFFTSLNIA